MQSQFSLFGKRPLFPDAVLDRVKAEWRREAIPAFDAISKAMKDFSQSLRGAKGRAKETALEQAFNNAFFVDLLGYQLFPGIDRSWTAWPKPPSSATGLDGEPDLLLGTMGTEGFETLAVVELKRLGALLDAPQPSYGNRSPVEQAFGYAQNLPTCRWVIVSDMRFVRLYSIDTAEEYHEIDLWLVPHEKNDPLNRMETLHEAYRLLSQNYLTLGGTDSATGRLLNSARDAKSAFRDGFYKLYADIRADLLKAVETWSEGKFDRAQQVLAVQRLLDRLLFVFFCEDHPDRLLRNGLVRQVTENAVQSPGASTTKAYDQIKSLFHDLDVGVDTRHWQIPRYNGELFKPHPIIDSLSLSDDLYSKRYTWASPTGEKKVVGGVYGLHVFDFWRELDRDLLGNLFERSVGDLEVLAHGGRSDVRSAFGIFYTASRLARFVASSAISAMLAENSSLDSALARAGSDDEAGRLRAVDDIVDLLKQYRIADLSCGSGVFLTAALDALLSPYRKAAEAVAASDLTKETVTFRQSEVLRSSIFGADLLPQAVELAKLALWLTAARRNEPSADLGSNFMVGNTLDLSKVARLLENAGGKLDLVLGNPPWGGDFDRSTAAQLLKDQGLPTTEAWDSWEVFFVLAITVLKPGGRFALLVPDTLFSSEKKRTRDWLLRKCRLEKVYSLGPDWFSADVRMGTVVLQGVVAPADAKHQVFTMVLAGRNRKEAQDGRKPLTQIEAALAQGAMQERFRDDDERQIQVLASDGDLELLARIEGNSRELSEVSEHARGDEINADGLLWRCGNCMTYTVPGEKRKGGGYKEKDCPGCGARLSERDIVHDPLVSGVAHGRYRVPYVDGGALTRRYEIPTRRYLRTDLSPMKPALKPDAVFKGPKVLIRQAGVGVAATLVEDDCRCPQSVYIYRATPEVRDAGYTEEFLLGCLASRTMNYVIMKRFAEIDPARAFAKLTHAKILRLPIPRLEDAVRRQIAQSVCAEVRQLLQNPKYGSEADLRIEMLLRQLWGITPDEGRYINGFFSGLPDGQAVRDLFPEGAPVAVPLPSERSGELSADRDRPRPIQRARHIARPPP